jgi:molybdate transport system ATP-binding protein
MSFDVDIEKTVTSERRSFTLRVRFRTHARRSVIFGPSGAGKSLTLQAIAGLLRPDRGRIAFDDAPVFDSARRIDLPARARGFGYLFQDYALFPRLNVRQNIAFGLQSGLRNPSTQAGGSAPPNSRAANASAPRWPAHSRTRRAPCCSTNPSPHSTPSCATACAPSSMSCCSVSTSRC